MLISIVNIFNLGDFMYLIKKFLVLICFCTSIDAQDLSSLASEQKRLIDSNKTQQTKDSYVQSVFYNFQDKIISLHLKLLSDVRKSGVKLGNPRPQLTSISIHSIEDNGQFVVAGDGPYDKSPNFYIDGFGLVYAHFKIEDRQFVKTGIFSNDCKFRLSLNWVYYKDYDCSSAASGRLDSKMLSDMKIMLSTALKDK